MPTGKRILLGKHITCFMSSFSQDVENEGTHDLEEVSIDEILEAQREEQLKKQEEEKTRNKKLLERGLQPHGEQGIDEYP